MTPSPRFAINGRFLTQPVTGVQRYARNVINAMNACLEAGGATAAVVAPRGTVDPGLGALPLITAGPLTGHLWEQLTLPRHWEGRLLNLCNTAPALKTEQVVCIHDANIFVSPESYRRAFRMVYGTLQPLLAKRAARISTVSMFSARQIAHHLSLRPDDIAVLPNGHEHALAWDPSQSTLAPRLFGTGQPERPFVLALGSRARHKNIGLLLDIAPALAELDIDLIVAGGSNAIFSAEALGASSNVKTTGYVTDDDLAYLMDRALCLAFPSWTEGFGLPIIEAMARGCPVVSSDRASMPEVCGDAALMAPPNDPDAWLAKIRSLLESHELARELGMRGRERVRLFSWTDTARGYIDLMDDPEKPMPYRAETKPAADRVAVIVATARRPEMASATIRHLLRNQTLQPVTTIVSCVNPADAGDVAGVPGVRVITGPPGLAAQRNTALDALPEGIDIVVFFDDDFVAAPGWLATARRIFRERPDIAGLTGDVLVDGIKGPGLSFEEGAQLVSKINPRSKEFLIDNFSPYGCNMAFRMSAIGKLRFDERLVLYGWLEDRDFGARIRREGGLLVKCLEAHGVHLGVKSGRVAGERLGYSQIVNPIYMMRKGTMTRTQVADHIFRNVASNILRFARPEPFIDRRGRFRGNLRGFGDILRGRIDPKRAIEIKPVREGN